MMSEVFFTVRNFQDCTLPRRAHFEHQKLMKRFLGKQASELVAMDLLGPFEKIARRSSLVLVIADGCTKVARGIVLRKTSTATVSAAFLKYRIYA